MAVSATGAIAFTGTSPTRPGELYLKTGPDAPVKRLTGVNDEIASLPLGKSEVVSYTFEKFPQNGILTYPPDFDPSKKYPLVLLDSRRSRAASLMTFSAGAQLMAAKGWLVFQPNYRGSDNLGRVFQGAIGNDAGAGPAATSWPASRPSSSAASWMNRAWPSQGWSYGGYMTTWMIGNYPEVWKAAVAGAAVTDQIDQQNFSDGAGGRGRRRLALGQSGAHDQHARSVTNLLRRKDQGADADTRQHRRLSRADHAVVQTVPCAARRRCDLAVHRVSESTRTTRATRSGNATSRSAGSAGSKST
jgi:hypothetical protein